MADIVGPSSSAVGLACEGAALGCSIWGPCAIQAGSSEGSEETTIGALSLDEHQILVLTLDSIDLDGFEQVLGSVAHDDGRGGAEVAGEVTDGHAGAIDFAIVSCEEEIHVLGVTNDCLVDGTSARARNFAREERLR